jgi:hypothetical protein
VAAALLTLPVAEVNGAAGRVRSDMNSELSKHLVDSLVTDRLRTAERFRRAGARRDSPPGPYDTVTVRVGQPSDAQVVARLAELEGRRPLVDPTLVAEVEGEVRAARSLHDGTSVADPFRRTAHLTELLALRARHLHSTYRVPPRRRLAAWLRSLTAPR